MKFCIIQKIWSSSFDFWLFPLLLDIHFFLGGGGLEGIFISYSLNLIYNYIINKEYNNKELSGAWSSSGVSTAHRLTIHLGR